MSYWKLHQRSNCRSKLQRNDYRLYLTYSKYDLYRQKTATSTSHITRKSSLYDNSEPNQRAQVKWGGLTGGIAGVREQKASVRNLVFDMCGCGHGSCGDLLCEVMGNEDLVEAGHCLVFSTR
jgi:hypothetical protein